MSIMSSVPEVTLAQRIKQWKAAGLTAFGFLGPAHALLADGTGITATVISVLLTGTQAFAVCSIISAVLLARWYGKDADPDPFVAQIPIACCSVAGALLVVATCLVHWKAACGIAVLAVIFLLVLHRGTVIALAERPANWSAMLFTRVSSTVLTFGGWIAHWSATSLTYVTVTVTNRRLAFGVREIVTLLSRLRAPPAGGSDIEMGVTNGEGAQAA